MVLFSPGARSRMVQVIRLDLFSEGSRDELSSFMDGGNWSIKKATMVYFSRFLRFRLYQTTFGSRASIQAVLEAEICGGQQVSQFRLDTE
jgi:hypothetical protein